MKTVILSKDFKDQLKEKRAFTDIILQYVDESDIDLSNVTIKNSKLFFATFRNCSFKNAKFVNCEIIYGSFYGGNFENTLFENCTIDLTLFMDAIFKHAKILKSNLTWSAIFNSAIGEIDSSSSSKFKFFTDPSQVTGKDLEDVTSRIGPLLDSLDISIKHEIKQQMEKDLQKLQSIGMESVGSTEKMLYSKTSPLIYDMQNFSNMIIDAYNTANPYKNKKSIYEKEGKYKS